MPRKPKTQPGDTGAVIQRAMVSADPEQALAVINAPSPTLDEYERLLAQTETLTPEFFEQANAEAEVHRTAAKVGLYRSIAIMAKELMQRNPKMIENDADLAKSIHMVSGALKNIEPQQKGPQRSGPGVNLRLPKAKPGGKEVWNIAISRGESPVVMDVTPKGVGSPELSGDTDG